MDKTLAHSIVADMSHRCPGKLIEFGRAMFTADLVGDEWWYFIDRAEKWSGEYALWAEHGYPQDGDPEWQAWIDAVEVYAA